MASMPCCVDEESLDAGDQDIFKVEDAMFGCVFRPEQVRVIYIVPRKTSVQIEQICDRSALDSNNEDEVPIAECGAAQEYLSGKSGSKSGNKPSSPFNQACPNLSDENTLHERLHDGGLQAFTLSTPLLVNRNNESKGLRRHSR